MKKKFIGYSRRIISFILAFIMVFTSLPMNLLNINNEAQAAGTGEMDNRETVYFPSDGINSVDQSFAVPYSVEQSATINGNVVTLTNSTDEVAFITSKEPINITNNDYVWVYNYSAPINGNIGIEKDGGFTFSLHNNEKYVPEANGDYGALGLYANRTGNVGLKNAVTVEFDNNKRYEYDDSLPTTVTESHIAITDPQSYVYNNTVIHESLSNLPTSLWNNTNNTFRISWTLINEGTAAEKSDNTYRLTYEYYQGKNSAVGQPTAKSSKDFSYAQILSTFNVTADNENIFYSISGSTGSNIKTQTISYPTTYQYTVNHYIQTNNGTKTEIPVPNIDSKTGYLPAGDNMDIGPLPEGTIGYTLVDGQSDIVTISTNPDNNVFNYYYTPDQYYVTYD